MLSRLSLTASRCTARLATPTMATVPARHFGFGSGEKKPVRVSVTGAAGNIGYALIYRIASGEMLGKDQPVILQLLELPDALTKLKGTVMELEDCAFPLLRGVVQTSDEQKAFEGADYALLVGARPRTKGMERNDLLVANGEIFTKQGKALNSVANRDTLRVVVVGNPANTNCLIAARNAPNIDPKRFTAMTRLDHNRAMHQIAQQTGSIYNDIKKLTIWGNHSSTMYPDVTSTTIKGKDAKQTIGNDAWLKDTFLPIVQQRGAAIIAARGSSSAASAAGSAIDHIHDWVLGTPKDDWTSMAVYSDGSYGVEKGLYFSFPVTCSGGEYKIVQGLKFDQYGQEKFDKTQQELKDEKKAVEHLLK